MQFCCSLFHVLLCKIFLPPIWATFLGDLSKNYSKAICPYIDCVSLQNLESVALMVSEERCLDMTHRRTDERPDMAKSLFLVALIKNMYRVSHVSFDLLHTSCLN